MKCLRLTVPKHIPIFPRLLIIHRHILLLTLAAISAAEGQEKHPITGRPIAPVMSAAGADWLERSDRESEENPAKAIEALDLKPGMVVCDLGAGTGYYSIRMARKVGPSGKVYAVDIQQKMLDLLSRRLESAGIRNIEPVLGEEADPKLPAKSQDLVLMVDVYHELSRPQAMLSAIRSSLKDDGRLVLLEFRKEDPSVPIRLEHKMSIKDVKAELEPEGFRIEKVLDILPWQHIIVCRKK